LGVESCVYVGAPHSLSPQSDSTSLSA
jgi:hypothetical protein